MANQLHATQTQQLASEHSVLRSLLRDVDVILKDRYSPVSLVIHRLADLRDQVSRHFVVEEQGGFFNQITEQEPRLRPKANRLLREHLQLYTEISGIAEDAERLAGTQIERSSLLDRFETFSKHLSAHEGAEHALLQETYCSDVGTKD